jgi:hypothetical protein
MEKRMPLLASTDHSQQEGGFTVGDEQPSASPAPRPADSEAGLVGVPLAGDQQQTDGCCEKCCEKSGSWIDRKCCRTRTRCPLAGFLCLLCAPWYCCGRLVSTCFGFCFRCCEKPGRWIDSKCCRCFTTEAQSCALDCYCMGVVSIQSKRATWTRFSLQPSTNPGGQSRKPVEALLWTPPG